MRSADLIMDENLEENQKETPTSFENLDNKSPYQNPESSYTSPPSRRRSPRKLLYVLGAVVLVLILLNVVRSLGSKGKNSTPSPTPTSNPTIQLETSNPSPSEQPTPTATPKPSPVSSIDKTTGLDRAKLSVTIQNGSGEAGVAQTASDYLKDLGYNVISTGNADNFNYKNVTIKVKPSQKDYLPVLNKDLSSKYSVGATSSDLTATSSADALVIVGK